MKDKEGKKMKEGEEKFLLTKVMPANICDKNGKGKKTCFYNIPPPPPQYNWFRQGL